LLKITPQTSLVMKGSSVQVRFPAFNERGHNPLDAEDYGFFITPL